MTGNFMLLPLDFTDEEAQVYKTLYKKTNYKTMEVKYTLQLLEQDCNPIFTLTQMKIRRILKKLIKELYLEEVKKGTKGSPTVYKIIPLAKRNEQLYILNKTAMEQKRMSNSKASPSSTNTNEKGMYKEKANSYYKYNNNKYNNGVQALGGTKGVEKHDYGY